MSRLSFIEDDETPNDLIRRLVKRRALVDGLGSAEDIDEMLGEVPEAALWGMPEASIVTIVQTIVQGLAAGVPGDQIVMAITQHRAQGAALDQLPPPGLDAAQFVAFRMSIECPGVMADDHIRYCTQEAMALFAR